MIHIPVLQKEILHYLDPKANENFVDATIGWAGHTLSILEMIEPDGQVLGIETDSDLYQELKNRETNESGLVLVNDSYVNLENIVENYDFGPINGILFDLGMSSWHLEKSGRGFSFQKNEPLDMRYSQKGENYLTAEKIINNWSYKEIEETLKKYGEERFSRSISKMIIEERKRLPIEETFQLVEVIRKSVPIWYTKKRIHFATKTFQALRIVVNQELDNIEKALPQALNVLEKGGKIAVISFHSLEDRLIKNFFKEKKREGLLEILTKKPIGPSSEEIKENHRSRSAKLRVAKKI